MCLPVGCIKGMLSFFAFITIVVGLAAIGISSYELVDKAQHIDFGEYNATTIAIGLLLGFGILCLLIGIIGMVGSSRKSKCCLCIYQFSVFPMVIISLSLACLATYSSVNASDMNNTIDQLANCKYSDDYCDGCGNDKSLEWIKNVNFHVYEATMNVFGQSEDCIILAADDDQAAEYETYLPGVRTSTDPNATGVVSSVLSCELEGKVKDAAKFLNFFEEEFKCSGFCAATPFYVFYDSTKPIEQTRPSCYEKIQNFLSNTLVTVIAWIIFAFYLLNLTLACCLCCHPDKKQQNQGEGLYQRMNYYDQ